MSSKVRVSLSDRISAKLHGAFKKPKHDEAIPEPPAIVSAINQPNTSNEDYVYEELDDTVKEIRLITIEPALSLNAPVLATLTHTSLDQPLPYEALSYTWGSPLDQVVILLNKQHFYVTKGLHEALTHLRLPDVARTLWVDAICINQLSIPERNSQVRYMRTIYRESQRTLIWLGPAFKDSDRLMDYMGWEDRRLLDPNLDGESDEFAAARYDRAMDDPNYDYLWEALNHLSQKPYWKRMWIIQEVAFGTAPLVCVGTKVVGFWDALVRIISSLACELENRNPGGPVKNIWAEVLDDNKPEIIACERRDTGQAKGANWVAARLLRYHGSLATDPRDKLIALLGFLDESQFSYDHVFEIDYARPVIDLYADIFRFCVIRSRVAETEEDAVTGTRPDIWTDMDITVDQGSAAAEGREVNDSDVVIVSKHEVPMSRNHGPLNILSAAGLRSDNVDDFPTWLPNWGREPPSLPIDDLSNNRFKVAQNSPPSCSISADNRVFTTFGCQLTRLSHVGKKYKTPNPDPVEMVNTIASWYQLAKKNSGAVGFQKPHFWRTLALDSFLNRWFTTAPEEWYGLEIDWLVKFAKSMKKHGNNKPDKVYLTNEYILMLQRTTRGRRFALSVESLYMLVPDEAMVGDSVVVFWGCDIPMIVRRVPGSKQWVLVGECFAFGMMDEKVLNAAVSIGLEAEDFEII